MKKIVFLALILIFLFLQYRLWIDSNGLRSLRELQHLVQAEKQTNLSLYNRNHQLDIEVRALKNDPEALEEEARLELGMIKKNETFFLVSES